MSLFEVCQTANSEQLRTLIDQKCDMTLTDEHGRTALHYCSDHQTILCADLLLQDAFIKHSILNLQDNEGYSALHLACLNGNVTVVKYLCAQGADVKSVDHERRSLIHWITVCGHLNLFDLLIEYQAPVHTPDIYGAYPIHYASQLCGEQKLTQGLLILRKLLALHIDVNCLDEHQRTPFIWGASAGATDALRLLFKAGAHPLHVDKDSLTALHCAATRGHGSCIRLLVKFYGCSLESEDVNGCTALFYAVTLEHPKTCQVLLELKADPNHQDNRGRTPSHCAISKGHLACLKQLIKHHADIWTQNKHGDYPIHELVHSLSLYKQRHPHNDYTQLQSACFDVIRYVFQLYPKRINIPNAQHRTALHLAAYLGDTAICEVLMECGARINSFSRTLAGHYLTPYDLARIRSNHTCAEYLLRTYGGQRGNLLAHVLARRIQKYFREYQRRKLLAHHCSSPANETIDHLLGQAKICLDNKLIDDRFIAIRRKVAKPSTYLTSSPKEDREGPTAEDRRRHFAKSKTMMTTINRTVEDEVNPSEKIIIHTSNSISTSVKLYERHKLIAEELFKLKQARIHDHYIVITRPLYKILIENAFNPQSRQVEEIERYLETLLKAYETELEAIRRRAKSLPSKRSKNNRPYRITTKATIATKQSEGDFTLH